MNFKFWPKSEKKPEGTSYIKEYASMINEAYRLGGLPFFLIAVSFLVIILALIFKSSELIKSCFPFVTTMASVGLALGCGIFFYEASWKRKMLEEAQKRTDKIIDLVITKYLEGKQQIDAETVNYVLGLTKIITTSNKNSIHAAGTRPQARPGNKQGG
jgi:hypothetical protein